MVEVILAEIEQIQEKSRPRISIAVANDLIFLTLRIKQKNKGLMVGSMVGVNQSRSLDAPWTSCGTAELTCLMVLLVRTIL